MGGVHRRRLPLPVPGATFEDREGFLPSSDTGAAFHYSLPRDYGDVQAAVFNGETFARAEVNDQKSVQLRGTLRPAPGHGALHGLRFTGFYDKDAYVKNADRRRAIVGVTFEHPHVHAAFTYLDAKDQTSATKTAVNARAWSAWITPRTARGWEGLLRFDHQEPNTDVAGQKKDRFVAGWRLLVPAPGQRRHRPDARRRPGEVRGLQSGAADRAPDRRPRAGEFLKPEARGPSHFAGRSALTATSGKSVNIPSTPSVARTARTPSSGCPS